MRGWWSEPVAKVALGAIALLCAAAMPGTVAAIGQARDGATFNAPGSFAQFTPASADPRLAEMVAQRVGTKARMMRFTPAGVSVNGAARSVTVAVRIDGQVAQALSGTRSGVAEGTPQPGAVRIASTRYNLGLARGFGSFTRSAPATAPSARLSPTLSQAEIPDLAEFRPAPAADTRPSRFAARVEMQDGTDAVDTPRADVRLGERLLDVGGSYRLTRNLDVTAGVRYQQERDLRPLPDMEQQDSQAVYIGTQFRF